MERSNACAVSTVARWRTLPTEHKLHWILRVGVMALPASGDVASHGPKVRQWKTWVLTSGTEIQVPAPPAETSDQTKAELAELRQLQQERSPITNTAIQYYNAVPATQRWYDLAFALARAEKQSPNRQARLAGILHTALHDAVVVTWAAKYQFSRKPPSQMVPDVTPVVPINGAVPAPEPSYPSEHAAIAGTAVGILTTFFPKEEANLKATATEVCQTRLLMGANYRSDIDAGFALGQTVAQKALARAATDGADAKWTGTVPTGPGLWVGKKPLEPLQGTWEPWLMTRGDQFRPEPPPAVGSAEFQEEATQWQYLGEEAGLWCDTPCRILSSTAAELMSRLSVHPDGLGTSLYTL